MPKEASTNLSDSNRATSPPSPAAKDRKLSGDTRPRRSTLEAISDGPLESLSSPAHEQPTSTHHISVDAKSVADAGDGLAMWEARVYGPDGPSPGLRARRKSAERAFAYSEDPNPGPDPKILAKAGDGLAMWEIRLEEMLRSNGKKNLATSWLPEEAMYSMSSSAVSMNDAVADELELQERKQPSSVLEGHKKMPRQPATSSLQRLTDLMESDVPLNSSKSRPLAQASVSSARREKGQYQSSSDHPSKLQTKDSSLKRLANSMQKSNVEESQTAENIYSAEVASLEPRLVLMAVTGKLKPIGDASNFLTDVQSFANHLDAVGLAVRPRRGWGECCRILEKLLSDYRAENDTGLVPSIRAIVNLMRILQKDAPKDLRDMPQKIVSSFLLQTAKENPSLLRDQMLLFAPGGEDPLQFISHLALMAATTKRVNTLRQILQILREDEFASIWRTGEFVSSLFELKSVLKDQILPQKLYSQLQEAGFTIEGSFPRQVLIDIGLHLILPSNIARKNPTALSALRKLEEWRATNFHSYRIAAALRDVSEGTPDVAITSIEACMRTPLGLTWITTWRSRLANLFFKAHNPSENEEFLRKLYKVTPFPLEPQWLEAVMRHHSEVGDWSRFVDWVKFCIQSRNQSRSELGVAFVSRLAVMLKLRWGVIPVIVKNFLDAVRPWLAGDTADKQTDELFEAALGHGSAPELGPRETRLFETMKAHNRQGRWDRTMELYNDHIARRGGFSSRCLGLAITACQHKEGPRSESARAFLRDGHIQGQDVSRGVQRLLAGELRHGSDPGELLDAASRQGLELTPQLRNLAAQEYLAQNRSREAIQVCEQAAVDHGSGELAFDQFQFSNLLSAYVRESTPEALDALVALLKDFMARPRWWHRENVCKLSIKHQMKVLIKREERYGHQARWHENALRALDDALCHVSRCRELRGEPWEITRQLTELFILHAPHMSDKPRAKARAATRRAKRLRSRTRNPMDRRRGLVRRLDGTRKTRKAREVQRRAARRQQGRSSSAGVARDVVDEDRRTTNEAGVEFADHAAFHAVFSEVKACREPGVDGTDNARTIWNAIPIPA